MTTLKQDLEADDVTRQTTALLSVLNYLAGECLLQIQGLHASLCCKATCRACCSRFWRAVHLEQSPSKVTVALCLQSFARRQRPIASSDGISTPSADP